MSTEAESTAALALEGEDDLSLPDILDHVLNSGVVIHGSLVISLAGVDLIYVGLNVILTSVESALRNMNHDENVGQTRRSGLVNGLYRGTTFRRLQF